MFEPISDGFTFVSVSISGDDWLMDEGVTNGTETVFFDAGDK